uniref:Uncharacterized protein n=1 Tax=Fish-associated hepevirus TaxID=3003971 RepID=A0A9E9FYD9_9VIRU|nr:MAG: hypothetical protein [Fish-associated hepevirus]
MHNQFKSRVADDKANDWEHTAAAASANAAVPLPGILHPAAAREANSAFSLNFYPDFTSRVAVLPTPVDGTVVVADCRLLNGCYPIPERVIVLPGNATQNRLWAMQHVQHANLGIHAQNILNGVVTLMPDKGIVTFVCCEPTLAPKDERVFVVVGPNAAVSKTEINTAAYNADAGRIRLGSAEFRCPTWISTASCVSFESGVGKLKKSKMFGLACLWSTGYFVAKVIVEAQCLQAELPGIDRVLLPNFVNTKNKLRMAVPSTFWRRCLSYQLANPGLSPGSLVAYVRSQCGLIRLGREVQQEEIVLTDMSLAHLCVALAVFGARSTYAMKHATEKAIERLVDERNVCCFFQIIKAFRPWVNPRDFYAAALSEIEVDDLNVICGDSHIVQERPMLLANLTVAGFVPPPPPPQPEIPEVPVLPVDPEFQAALDKAMGKTGEVEGVKQPDDGTKEADRELAKTPDKEHVKTPTASVASEESLPPPAQIGAEGGSLPLFGSYKAMTLSEGGSVAGFTDRDSDSVRSSVSSTRLRRKKDKRYERTFTKFKGNCIVAGDMFQWGKYGPLVNAANKDLVKGGGVCKQFYESFKLDTWKPAPIKPGEAALDPNGNVHAVAPNTHRKEPLSLLVNAYQNAHKLGGRVFPLLGAGIYGCPVEASVMAFMTLDEGILVVPAGHPFWNRQHTEAERRGIVHGSSLEMPVGAKRAAPQPKGDSSIPFATSGILQFTTEQHGTILAALTGTTGHFAALDKEAADKLPEPGHECPMAYWQGAPGTGKTYGAKQILDKKRTLVVAPTRRLVAEWKDAGFTSRTPIDAIAHPVLRDVLVVDEASLMCGCYVGALAASSKAKATLLLGDHLQVASVDFTKTKVHRGCKSAAELIQPTRKMMQTHRCPQDITKLLRRNGYPDISSTSMVVNSVINAAAPADVQVVRICGEQATKAAHGADFTAHEAQGATFQRVELILGPGDITLFSRSPGHFRVAISRHTKELYVRDPTGQGTITLGLSAIQLAALQDNAPYPDTLGRDK